MSKTKQVNPAVCAYISLNFLYTALKIQKVLWLEIPITRQSSLDILVHFPLV